MNTHHLHWLRVVLRLLGVLFVIALMSIGSFPGLGGASQVPARSTSVTSSPVANQTLLAPLECSSPSIGSQCVPGPLNVKLANNSHGGGQSQVTPTLTCVDLTGGQRFTAYFGYDNSGRTVTYQAGSHFNRVSPGNPDGGQPSIFNSGTVTNAFNVNVNAGFVTWTVGNNSVSASEQSVQCSGSTLPGDPLGLMFLLMIGVGIAFGVLFILFTIRRRSSL